MLKVLYNAFLIMLVLELAFEEYGRIKAVIEFFKKISVSIRIRGKVLMGRHPSTGSKMQIKEN